MPDRWYQGFLKTASGALVVVGGAAPVLPLKMCDGYTLDQNKALVVSATLGGMGWRQGHLRDLISGILGVTTSPVGGKWQDGDFINANGALIIAQDPQANQRFIQGALRAPNGALICDIRGTP